MPHIVAEECLESQKRSTGETRLKAITKELERQSLSQNRYYNTDGVVFDTDSGLELCLLEISGPFGLVDASREPKDQIKAAYGLLSMLHTVAYEFVHVDIQLFQKLKICFIHAHQNQIRLWSFGLVGKQLYVMSRVDIATAPTSYSDSYKDDFMKLINIFWKIKMLTENAVISLNELKDSHIRNQAANVSDIFISSSPILPDSP